MSLFTTLCESTDPIAKEVATTIRIHPAFPYIRTSYLYDSIYLRFKSECDNIKEARLRTMLHITHILDEIAHSLGIIDTNLRTSVPENIFQDAFSNPKYKAYSDKVTHESRLRQQQRLRKKAKETAVATTASVSINASTDPFNSLMHNFVTPKPPNK